MHLSTSSFDNKLTKSLILVCVFIFIYSWVLQITQPDINTYQNQWIRNYSISEKFIYSNNRFDTIVVGSSLTGIFSEDAFGDDVFNLSFVGGSVLTGLDIVKNKNVMPKTIYIETNIVERSLKKEMVKRLFTPIVWKIKKYLLSTRYTFQPINIFLTHIKNKLRNNNNYKTHAAIIKKKFNIGLMKNIEKTENIDILVENDNFNLLKDLVTYFKQKGVKIVFLKCR